jgi:signal peptidase
MEEGKEDRSVRRYIHQFRTSDHWAVSLARDILWLVAVVGSIALVLYLICGTWPAVVTIESESMVPNMNVGDLVVVVQKERYGDFQTWAEGKVSGVRKFNDYGDVIVYRPNGRSGSVIPVPFVSSSPHPIIHRAMMWIEAKDISGNMSAYYTPHAGYITKGDHNKNIDQLAVYPDLGLIEPVKEEWVIGKALFTIPLVGYLPLHIVWVIAVVLILMGLHELYLRSREKEKRSPQKKPGKKRR